MSDFYKRFEDKFRGSRELIYDRLKVYLGFVIPLQENYPSELWLDLGCGRGEWLELLSKTNVKALGIDVDEEMLSACTDIGLSVCLGDAVSFLEGKPDESFIGITAFHVAEHLTSDELHKLIEQSFRVLKPGGILIIETPNPENIVVGSCGFYLDPTHIKPIPPQLLEFMSSYYGFYRSVILRLQEPKRIAVSGVETLTDVFLGVSPDYAIVSQKKSGDDGLDSLDIAFSKKTGLTLEELSMSYHEKTGKEFKIFSDMLSDVSSSMNSKMDFIIKELSAGFFEERKVFEGKLDELTKRAIKAEMELAKVYKSRSWRVTYPFRVLGSCFRFLFFKKSNFGGVSYLLGRFFCQSIDFLYRYPRVKKHLSRVARLLKLNRVLHGIYFQLSNAVRSEKKEEAAIYNLSERPSEKIRSLGSLSVEEILARIEIELATSNQKKKGD